jgi:hypothetical protein
MYLILILLVIVLFFSMPVFPYSRGWGYYPSGFVTILLILLVFMALTGRL